jgi:hypothetical protein
MMMKFVLMDGFSASTSIFFADSFESAKTEALTICKSQSCTIYLNGYDIAWRRNGEWVDTFRFGSEDYLDMMRGVK